LWRDSGAGAQRVSEKAPCQRRKNVAKQHRGISGVYQRKTSAAAAEDNKQASKRYLSKNASLWRSARCA